MSSFNVPDDWDLYYTNCQNCGKLYHQSENYCDYCADDDYIEDDSFKEEDVEIKLQENMVNFISLLVSNKL